MSSIDYDLTQIKAFAFDNDGVLSPCTVPMDLDGVPLRMVNIKDGYAIQLARKLGYEISIITGGNNPSIRKRYNALGVEDVYLGASLKLPILQEWMKFHNLEPREVIYMGDDIPDLPALRHVGLPCVPHDAAWECKQEAHYISPFTGGYGCARDVIEQVLRAKGEWLHDLHAFGW